MIGFGSGSGFVVYVFCVMIDRAWAGDQRRRWENKGKRKGKERNAGISQGKHADFSQRDFNAETWRGKAATQGETNHGLTRMDTDIGKKIRIMITIKNRKWPTSKIFPEMFDLGK
jgi:hypothetical protein